MKTFLTICTVQPLWRFVKRHFLFLIILLIGTILRFSWLNWDNLYLIHPDERAIAYAVANLDFMALKFNPEFYAYGHFPMYLIKMIAYLLSLFHSDWLHYEKSLYIGRFISAGFSVMTILLTYLFGQKIGGIRVGLFSALMITFTTFQIQDSHFATVDVILAFFITLILYYLLDLYKGHMSWHKIILVSFLMGLTLSIKASAYLVYFIYLYAVVIGLGHHQKRTFRNIALYGFSGLGLTILSHILTQPYGLIQFNIYVQELLHYVELSKTAGLVPYTIQYKGSPFVTYYLSQLYHYLAGQPLTVILVAGVLYGTYISIKTKFQHPVSVLVLWILPYFILINTFEAKFPRYLHPVIPVALILGAYFCTKIVDSLKTKGLYHKLFIFLLSLSVIYTILFSLAFCNIFAKPHTFIQASSWIYHNIPEGKKILMQHWDEGLPLQLRDKPSKKWEMTELPLYDIFDGEKEGEKKAMLLASELVETDYLFIQSKRLYGAVLKEKDKRVVTNTFFKLLFEEKLGFKLIKSFTSPPSIAGITFDDSLSDESFSVYTHPKILIFKKNKVLESETIKNLLIQGEHKMSDKDLLLFPHQDSDQHYESTLLDHLVYSVIWLCLIVSICLPFSILWVSYGTILPPSSLCLILTPSLLAFNYIFWLGTSLNLFLYYGATGWFLLTIFYAFTGIFLYKNKPLLPDLFKQSKDFLFLLGLFLMGFSLILLIRSLSPEIYWGEKPMDFAIFNNLMRLNTLPPLEPWFSSQPLNYYYFGYFVYASLSKMLMIPAGIAYNLSLATVGGLILTSLYGIIFCLTHKKKFSLLSSLIILLVGNFSSLKEFFIRFPSIDFHYYWATSRAIKDAITEYPLWSLSFGDLHGHLMAIPIYLTVIGMMIVLLKQLPHAVTRKRIVVITVFAGFLLGSSVFTNYWDFPTLALLYLGFCTLFLYHLKKYGLFLSMMWGLLWSMGIVISSFLFFFPFWMSLYIQKLNGHSVPFQTGWVSVHEHIDIGSFMFAHGIVLCLPILYILMDCHTTKKQYFKILLGVFCTTLVIATYSSISVMLLGVFILLFFYITKIGQKASERLILLLFALAVLIYALSDLIFAYDRMNTIFKFYVEAWYFMAIASAYYVYRWMDRKDKGILASRTFSIVLVGSLVLGFFTSVTSIYGFSKTDRVKNPPGIDGFAYMKYKNNDDYRAIQWIKKHIYSSKILLEAAGDAYSDSTRISMNTGLPTFVGWEHHLTQRGIDRDSIHKRIELTKNIYESMDADIVHKALKEHDISYIYVGSLEKELYPSDGLDKFRMYKNMFGLIYMNASVRIYKVL